MKWAYLCLSNNYSTLGVDKFGTDLAVAEWPIYIIFVLGDHGILIGLPLGLRPPETFIISGSSAHPTLPGSPSVLGYNRK